ncbi:MAG: hypothetical protein IPL78_12040 [Chloroflexi bacterium]|nr:hypothetical protein [Chloroflexota bacterium]
MTQAKQPPPESSPCSGGITLGDQTAQGNVTTHLENVAGGDQISHSQVVQHANTVYMVSVPPTEKPGFSPLQLPLDEIPTPTSLPPGSRMLMGLNPHFVGRERELKQVAQVSAGIQQPLGRSPPLLGWAG